MRKVISIFLFMAFILLPLQIVAAGDEQHQSEIQQSTEESIVETAEGLNNLEGNAKSSDFFGQHFLGWKKQAMGNLS